MFDPYQDWLGIAPGGRPPTHYQLLGISRTEASRAVIEAALIKRMAQIRAHLQGPQGPTANRLLNELAEARQVLLDPHRRSQYDAQLQAKAPSLLGAVRDLPAGPPPGPKRGQGTILAEFLSAPPAESAEPVAEPIADPIAAEVKDPALSFSETDQMVQVNRVGPPGQWRRRLWMTFAVLFFLAGLVTFLYVFFFPAQPKKWTTDREKQASRPTNQSVGCRVGSVQLEPRLLA